MSEQQSSADSAVAIRKPVFKPPFEVYHNGNEIGDTNGPVCTAEDEETAQALVLALNAHFTQPQTALMVLARNALQAARDALRPYAKIDYDVDNQPQPNNAFDVDQICREALYEIDVAEPIIRCADCPSRYLNGGCSGCPEDAPLAVERSQADSSPQTAPELTATCQKLLPGGIIDDATYAEIEDALDRADAPATVGGRWLKLHERIAALTAERPAASAEPQSHADSSPQAARPVDLEAIAEIVQSERAAGSGHYDTAQKLLEYVVRCQAGIEQRHLAQLLTILSVMKSAHSKEPDRLMSIWSRDIEAVEAAVAALTRPPHNRVEKTNGSQS